METGGSGCLPSVIYLDWKEDRCRRGDIFELQWRFKADSISDYLGRCFWGKLHLS